MDIFLEILISSLFVFSIGFWPVTSGYYLVHRTDSQVGTIYVIYRNHLFFLLYQGPVLIRKNDILCHPDFEYWYLGSISVDCASVHFKFGIYVLKRNLNHSLVPIAVPEQRISDRPESQGVDHGYFYPVVHSIGFQVFFIQQYGIPALG